MYRVHIVCPEIARKVSSNGRWLFVSSRPAWSTKIVVRQLGPHTHTHTEREVGGRTSISLVQGSSQSRIIYKLQIEEKNTFAGEH